MCVRVRGGWGDSRQTMWESVSQTLSDTYVPKSGGIGEDGAGEGRNNDLSSWRLTPAHQPQSSRGPLPLLGVGGGPGEGVGAWWDG